MLPDTPSVSIIICTRNRAAMLQQTLDAFGKVRIPSDWNAEIVVLDNGSSDATAMVVRNCRFRNLVIRYVYTPTKGKSRALNLALTEVRGSVILFTDDDVVIPEGWVEQMVLPIVTEGYDAVVGRIALAAHLVRPWMTDLQRKMLAWNDEAGFDEKTCALIGASMGFRRAVLDHVSAFDPELGPGALGLGEDTLFGLQLGEAGFRIGYARRTRVLHHFDESRLRRANWLELARSWGRTEAYIQYHWKHEKLRHPRLKWLVYWTKLHLRRLLQPPPRLKAEGCPAWELYYVIYLERFRQFCRERRRPRNYARRGLSKRTARPASRVKN